MMSRSLFLSLALSATALASSLGCSSSDTASGTTGTGGSSATTGTGGGTSTGTGSGGAAAASFVFVHGAWMGAWAWDEVGAALKAKGASVTAVELPGHGADMTAVNAITLDTYVAKAGDAVAAASGPVYLVGHSMGGMVITQVAEKMPTKITGLVYLAAAVPKDGQSLQALVAADADSHIAANLQIDAAAGVGKIAMDKLQDIFCADCSATQMAEISSHYRDEPLGPFGAAAHITDANWGKVTKYYVYTKQDNALSYNLQKTMTTGVTFAKTATLDRSHSPFISHSSEVTEVLLGFLP